MQRGKGTKKEKERYGGRKRNREGEREGDKGLEAEENRKFGEWRRRVLRWQMTSLHSRSVLGRVLVTKSRTELSLLSSLANAASS